MYSIIQHAILNTILPFDLEEHVPLPSEWQFYTYTYYRSYYAQMKVFEYLQENCDKETYIAKSMLYVFAKQVQYDFFYQPFSSKMRFVKRLTQNPFLTPSILDKIFGYFSKAQRTYYAFSRLLRIWKLRRAKVQIQMDLYMNDLDKRHLHTFVLLQQNNLYYFSLTNLINIIVTAITHSSHFFHSPLPVKNPYNNVVFSKADLYNVYFSAVRVYIKIPAFFRRFFECDFDVYRFKMEHESALQKHAILQYIESANSDKLVEDIRDMLNVYNIRGSLRFVSGFPENAILKAFRPFLLDYYLSHYSFSRVDSEYAEYRLTHQLRQWFDMNPHFGKRAIEKSFVQKDGFVETFSTASKSESRVQHFMSNHIFDSATFDRYTRNGNTNLTYLDPVVISQIPPFRMVQPPIPIPTTQSRELSESDSDEEEADDSDEEEDDNPPVIQEESEEAEPDEEEEIDW